MWTSIIKGTLTHFSWALIIPSWCTQNGNAHSMQCCGAMRQELHATFMFLPSWNKKKTIKSLHIALHFSFMVKGWMWLEGFGCKSLYEDVGKYLKRRNSVKMLKCLVGLASPIPPSCVSCDLRNAWSAPFAEIEMDVNAKVCYFLKARSQLRQTLCFLFSCHFAVVINEGQRLWKRLVIVAPPVLDL